MTRPIIIATFVAEELVIDSSRAGGSKPGNTRMISSDSMIADEQTDQRPRDGDSHRLRAEASRAASVVGLVRLGRDDDLDEIARYADVGRGR